MPLGAAVWKLNLKQAQDDLKQKSVLELWPPTTSLVFFPTCWFYKQSGFNLMLSTSRKAIYYLSYKCLFDIMPLL